MGSPGPMTKPSWRATRPRKARIETSDIMEDVFPMKSSRHTFSAARLPSAEFSAPKPPGPPSKDPPPLEASQPPSRRSCCQVEAGVMGPSYLEGRPILSTWPMNCIPVSESARSHSSIVRSSMKAKFDETRHWIIGAPGEVFIRMVLIAALRWSMSPRSVVIGGVFPTKSSRRGLDEASGTIGTRPICAAVATTSFFEPAKPPAGTAPGGGIEEKPLLRGLRASLGAAPSSSSRRRRAGSSSASRRRRRGSSSESSSRRRRRTSSWSRSPRL